MNEQYGMNPYPHGQFGMNPKYIGVRRDGIVVLLLSIVTCGVYAYYWYYQAMEDINRATGEQRINSVGLLIGSILCFPIIFVVLYQIDRELARLSAIEGTYYKENFVMWLLLSIFVFGIGNWVAMFQICGAYNQIWDRRSGVAPFTPPQ